MKQVKGLFSYCLIFGSLSFTIITTLFNIQYQEESSIYILYNLIIAMVGYLYFVNKVFFHKQPIIFWDIVCIIGMVISFIVSKYLLNNDSEMAFDFWTYMIIWAIPAYLYGVLIANQKKYEVIWKTVDVFMIAITIVVYKNAIYYYLNGRTAFSVSGTTTYQTMSYLAALAMGINYYLIIEKSDDLRPKLLRKSIIYKIFCFIMLALQAGALFISGGRGGMILAVTYFMVITCFFNKSTNKKVKYFVMAFSIVMMIFFLTSDNAQITEGLNRIFEFVGQDGGINWQGTSGRDEIYIKAFDLIRKKPIFGYGIWSIFKYIRNPHNIILELLLGGGIALLLLVIGLFIIVFKKYRSIIREDKNNRLFFIFFLYNFIMLMFSGTYLCAPTLWFFIGYVLNYKFLDKEKNIIKRYFII